MEINIIRRITKYIVVKLAVLTNRYEMEIQRELIPKFANNPSNLTLARPHRIIRPDKIHIGNDVRIGPDSFIYAKTKFHEPKAPEPYQRKIRQNFNPTIKIGNRVRSRSGLQIGAMKEVVIEDDVILAANVFISDGSHGYENANEPYRYQPLHNIKSIRIKKGSWIGQNVVIMPGVTIGEYSIIGSNSVVTRSIPPRSIATGIPARVTKSWDTDSKKWIETFEDEKHLPSHILA